MYPMKTLGPAHTPMSQQPWYRIKGACTLDIYLLVQALISILSLFSLTALTRFTLHWP